MNAPGTPRAFGWLRTLSIVDGLLALLAVWGGVSLIVGAPGFRLPVEWLASVGLGSWVLPGVELIVVIGGVLGWAAVACWRAAPHAPTVSLLAGVVLFAWLVVQLVVIGPRTPAQVLTAAADLLVIVLACGAAARRRSW
jgi:hypothetical protein